MSDDKGARFEFGFQTNDASKHGPIRRYLLITVAVILLLAISGLSFKYFSYQSRTVIGSLAVLPFLNVDANPELEYLSDGMTDSLISDLSHLPNLNVKARSSVFRYKGLDLSVRAVGAALNVQAILNGRVSQHGDLLALNLELTDARTENIIWSKHYSRKPTDLVFLQNEIVRDVSEELRLKLARADDRRQARGYTPGADAYGLYLKGRFYWNKRTMPDLEKAIDCFNQAIALEPNYALAYGGLADTYVVLSLYRDDLARDARLQARQNAMKGLLLDDDLAEAHATLGFVNTHQFDFQDAEREYQRALELNPHYATAHQWYGELLSHEGRHEESLAELQRALEIDPFSLIINVMYGNSLFYTRRYNDALSQLKKTLELDADFAITHQVLARVYQATGNYSEAVEEFARYQELKGEKDTATLVRQSFAGGGWQGFLRTVVLDQNRATNLSAYEKVVFLVALGENQKALDEVEQSYQLFGCVLKVDPLLDPLRDNERFVQFTKRVSN